MFKQGFTIIEILVAMAIFVTITIIGGNFVISGLKTVTYATEQRDAVADARYAISIMSKEIRGTNNSERGDYPIDTFDGNNFIFYSDVNYSGEMKKVQYVRYGTEVKKVITPPGSAKDYNMPSSTSTIARYVNNQPIEPIFTYYDNDYSITSDIDDIRLININLKINVTPAKIPGDYHVETDVNLRNLKNNL